ncbi:YjgP/YjgQ family permease [bacterium]|nr:MAG: YjgP/YjgQ family permease [bacterium]
MGVLSSKARPRNSSTTRAPAICILEKALPASSNTGRANASKTTTRKAERPMKLRRDGVIPIADSYLLRGVVESSLRGLFWFVGLFLAFAIVTSARRVAQDGLPASLVLELISLQMPRIVLFTIPASLLFGTMSTFTEMSGRGEITALMAGGMSLWRMIRGPLLYALIMGVVAFWLQEVVVPGSESRKDSIVKGAGSRIGIQNGFKIVDARDNGTVKRIVQADSFDPSTLSLEKPVVQFFRENNTLNQELEAKSARWDPQNKKWILEDVYMLTTTLAATRKANDPFARGSHFDTWVLETDASLLPSALTSTKLTTADRLKKQNYEMVSMKDLKIYRSQLLAEYSKEQGQIRANTLKKINGTTFGIHDKFATPLVCLAMILIGAPLGIRPQRSASAGLAMGLSLAVLILYYIIWTLCTSWGKGGGEAPQYVAYFSFLMTTAIGLVMVARKS